MTRAVSRALLGGVAGLALVALALILRRGGDQEPFEVKVFVNHDGQLREQAPGEPVSPGDALVFALQPPPPPAGHLVVLGRDASGAVKLYHPEEGATAAPVQLTGQGFLPFSVQLDEAPGAETLSFFVCAGPTLVGAIRSSLPAPGPAPPGCSSRSLVLDKRPAAGPLR